MGRSKHITPNQRERCVALRDHGLSYGAISKELGISKHAVFEAVRLVNKTKSSANPIRKRQRKTTPREDRLIHRCSEADRTKTAVDIHRELAGQLSKSVSIRTIQSRLAEFGLKGRIARKKPYISEKNKKKRLEFARAHLDWTDNDWAKVLFTDESKFCISGSGGRKYIRRRTNEEFNPKCTRATVKHDKNSVMVWAGMSASGPGPLYRVNGIMDRFQFVNNILDGVLRPYAESNCPSDWIYQADNDPKHSSKLAQKYISDQQWRRIEWPPQSPDLSPIEMLWIDVEREIQKEKPKSKDDLFSVIEKAWNDISMDRCSRLVKSMHSRCQEVIKNKGFATSY